MSIWPFGLMWRLAEQPGVASVVGAWVASPKLSKRDCKPEEQDRGLPERLRLKLHSDVLERAFEGLKGLLGLSVVGRFSIAHFDKFVKRFLTVFYKIFSKVGFEG